MHIFVSTGQLCKIMQLFARVAVVYAFQDLLQNRFLVIERLLSARQGEIPASIMRHHGGVIQRIGGMQQRSAQIVSTAVTQTPALLKPGQVTQFPQRRVDNREPRSE